MIAISRTITAQGKIDILSIKMIGKISQEIHEQYLFMKYCYFLDRLNLEKIYDIPNICTCISNTTGNSN